MLPGTQGHYSCGGQCPALTALHLCRTKRRSNDILRPGKLLSCIAAMQAELQQMQGKSPQLERLEDIRRETLTALSRLSNQ